MKRAPRSRRPRPLTPTHRPLALSSDELGDRLGAPNVTAAEVIALNKQLALVERLFLAPGGLPQRRWYRNVLMASGFDKGYGAETLPGITQAIKDGDERAAESQAAVAAAAIEAAADFARSGVLPADEEAARNRRIALGVGLGLGLPLVAALLFYVVSRRRAAAAAERAEFGDVFGSTERTPLSAGRPSTGAGADGQAPWSAYRSVDDQAGKSSDM